MYFSGKCLKHQKFVEVMYDSGKHLFLELAEILLKYLMYENQAPIAHVFITFVNYFLGLLRQSY